MDYIGVFSWKFPYKTNLTKDQIWYLTQGENVDVISFCQQIPRYLEFTEKVHPGFMPSFKLLCEHLDLKIEEPKCCIYSNFFVAKKSVYKAFIEKIIKPAIEWMERPEIFPLVMRDAKYTNGLKPDQLKQFTELNHYPFTIFLLERLISIVIDNWGLTYKIKNKIG